MADAEPDLTANEPEASAVEPPSASKQPREVDSANGTASSSTTTPTPDKKAKQSEGAGSANITLNTNQPAPNAGLRSGGTIADDVSNTSQTVTSPFNPLLQATIFNCMEKFYALKQICALGRTQKAHARTLDSTYLDMSLTLQGPSHSSASLTQPIGSLPLHTGGLTAYRFQHTILRSSQTSYSPLPTRLHRFERRRLRRRDGLVCLGLSRVIQ